MVTMTIHADETFATALRAYAKGLGTSVNQTVKDVFAPILGLAKEQEVVSPWQKYYGAIPETDVPEWDRQIDEMRSIDGEIWK